MGNSGQATARTAKATTQASGATAQTATQTAERALVRGQVVRLDRGYPLVRLDDGRKVRCEHATALVKGAQDVRAVIGDFVQVDVPDGHDKGIIDEVLPRTRAFVRKDPTERALPQVLAANFDRVVVAQPLSQVNRRRLERELVLAHETGAEVTVVLTKADLAESDEQVADIAERVQALVGPEVQTIVLAANDAQSARPLQELMPAGTTTVLIGKSGVGKSSLVNMLVGADVQETGSVREGDGKGRHTTVSREMIEIPGGGFVVDMPGVRGLGLWNADAGIGAAFSDVEELAAQCKFRDCKHEDEPGCAVRAAVEAGTLAQQRFESYQALKQETATLATRREEARRMRGEKASDRRSSGSKNGKGRRRVHNSDTKKRR